ncbi:RagB/SusD family nutrient uptake outer membrane protein [Pontibacter sp. G13]|uniref:RagB/SusD family nutrient uptake outer membrane protein n=1 Tax=Pontibacter sp. G13 TaxID=3074898 RepID=UPI00288BE80E|nr:RagB/SusD family nutrient uptake outer membrane protein [Pontibacter sp. G13]WNJ19238.1 RagB/SusD family nutrient uptake outer membrane protein [Pontibacter sp. G13]
MFRTFSYIRTWVLLALVAVTSACNDGFLEIVPEEVIDESEFVKTPEDLQQVLNSSYDALRSGNFMGGQAWVLADLMADHYDATTVSLNGDWAAHYTRTTDIFLGTTRSIMNDGYKVVARANFALGEMETVEGLSADEATRVTAEAKFLRGVALFELVRIFAHPYGYTADNSHLGLPIRTEFGRDLVGRSSVKECYDQILADLMDAAADLPTFNNGYATSWAAKAYLAKVYFQMNDFANAEMYASDVIENGPFELDADLKARFSFRGTTESIFELVSTDLALDNSGGYLRGNFLPNPANNNVPNITLDRTIASKATTDPLDQRGFAWYDANTGGARDIFMLTKFPTDSAAQVPIAHLTEMMLIRGESAAELGDVTTAEADLNAIRTRAGLTAYDGAVVAELLINAIRVERELELVGEGNRMHELKRQAANGDASLKIRGAIWTCPGLVAQIPDTELQGNGDMIPNEEGGCN